MSAKDWTPTERVSRKYRVVGKGYFGRRGAGESALLAERHAIDFVEVTETIVRKRRVLIDSPLIEEFDADDDKKSQRPILPEPKR